eukprot:GFUD01035548.1.p1 GENE.GFUD01035548.1~~GFUD01035548.1.p1  ORF type:complete len:117 (+),score=22.55 GFUD01035548.1:139-489(+)
MNTISSMVIFSCVLWSIICLVNCRRIEFQAPRSGKSCNGASYCEDPTDYPGPLIRTLLRNTTFPPGLFQKRSINTVKIQSTNQRNLSDNNIDIIDDPQDNQETDTRNYDVIENISS